MAKVDEDFDDVKFMLLTHWKKAWKRTTTLPVCERRIEELHPSSFPFCGIKYALSLATTGDGSFFDMPATMEYYCSVGTVAHLIFQKHMRLLSGNGKSTPVMIGDWTCPECGHLNVFRPYHSCKKCKSPSIRGEVARLSGDEISVQLGQRTTGHTDDVVRINGKYYVVDYKTSSVMLIGMYKKFGKALPYRSNVRQIESYVALLERKYNIKISGWFLMYISRDTPDREYAIIGDTIDEDKREYLHDYLDTCDKAFSSARKYIAPAINEGIPMFDGNTSKVDKYVKVLYKNKLCSCRKFYEEEVHDKYDPCPFAETDMCFNGSLPSYAKNVFLRVGTDIEEDEDEE